MPYKIEYRKGEKRPYKIVNTDRKAVVGSSSSRANAERSVKARLAAEHGGKLSSRKRKR